MTGRVTPRLPGEYYIPARNDSADSSQGFREVLKRCVELWIVRLQAIGVRGAECAKHALAKASTGARGGVRPDGVGEVGGADACRERSILELDRHARGVCAPPRSAQATDRGWPIASGDLPGPLWK